MCFFFFQKSAYIIGEPHPQNVVVPVATTHKSPISLVPRAPRPRTPSLLPELHSFLFFERKKNNTSFGTMHTLTSSIITVLFFSLLHLISASPHEKRSLQRRHTAHLAKRYDNARLTYFADGLGACGGTNGPNDFVR